MVWLEVREPTFHGVVEEPGDGLSVAGLFADELSEGLQAVFGGPIFSLVG